MSSRSSYLRRTYGITEDQYNAMAAAQGGACYLCGKKSRRVRLSVDHDHVTGTVRALLCARCNEGLGRFEYSNDLLTGLMAYAYGILRDRHLHALNLSQSVAPIQEG